MPDTFILDKYVFVIFNTYYLQYREHNFDESKSCRSRASYDPKNPT